MAPAPLAEFAACNRIILVSEALLYRVAHAYEQGTAWVTMHRNLV